MILVVDCGNHSLQQKTFVVLGDLTSLQSTVPLSQSGSITEQSIVLFCSFVLMKLLSKLMNSTKWI